MESMILGIGVTAGSLLLGRKMYQCRTMIPARVTCWFCSHRETVWFNQRNSWNCGDCGQYNGFDKDGDYNQEIVGQHSDIPVAASMRFTQPQQFKEATNALCDSCNRNQEMKMHQLRNFMPTNLNNEDEEQAEYTAHLERAFRLCRSCEARVRQVIGKQDSWLKLKSLSWKLALFRKSPLPVQDVNKPGLYWSLSQRVFLLFLATIIWIASLSSTSTSVKDWFNSNITVWSVDSTFGYFELVAVPLALALGYSKISRTIIWRNWLHIINIGCWLAILAQRFLEIQSFPVASLCLMTNLLVCSKRVPSKADNIVKKKREKRRKLIDQLNKASEEDLNEDELEITTTPTITPAETPTPPEQSQNNDLYLPNHEVYQHKSAAPGQCDMSTLQIQGLAGGFGGNATFRPSSPFSVKSYNPNNQSNIDFGDLSRLGGGAPNDSFIKPAKFVYNERNRVAQSSWVAGGYWQGKQNPGGPNQSLSRSSSQSSGIGSLTSATALQQKEFVSSLPNSRVNSVNGDHHERFSIFSEPAYKIGGLGGGGGGGGGVPKSHHPNMSSMSLRPINDQLAFYDTSSIAAYGGGMMPRPTRSPICDEIRSRSVLGNDDDDNDSFNSSLDRLSQAAFAKLQPNAESSPIDVGKKNNNKEYQTNNFLDRKITINVSLYSVFLFMSVAFNVSLSVYLAAWLYA